MKFNTLNFFLPSAHVVSYIININSSLNNHTITYVYRVDRSAVGKKHFAQLQVQLGSGKVSKKLELYTTAEPQNVTIIWKNMHSKAVVIFCHKFYGL